LLDAATYATKLPKNKRTPPMIEGLMLEGPTMFARIGVMRALNAGKPDPALVSRRKHTKAYEVIR
jgi:hypothetical protein